MIVSALQSFPTIPLKNLNRKTHPVPQITHKNRYSLKCMHKCTSNFSLSSYLAGHWMQQNCTPSGESTMRASLFLGSRLRWSASSIEFTFSVRKCLFAYYGLTWFMTDIIYLFVFLFFWCSVKGIKIVVKVKRHSLYLIFNFKLSVSKLF